VVLSDEKKIDFPSADPCRICVAEDIAGEVRELFGV
jgi:hypothetical protein